jgi:recombinase
MTLHALAAQLTARRVPTPTGRAVWRSTTIRNLLTNPAYKGEAASGRLRTAPARRRKSALAPVGKGVSTRTHPPQEWITVPVPRWSPPPSSTWSPGGWPPTSGPPGAAPPTPTCCADWSAAECAA